jgi:hypothetical protein
VLYEGSGLFSPPTTNIPEMELRITGAVIPVSCDILEENLTENGMRIRPHVRLLMSDAVKLVIGSRQRFCSILI